MHRSKHGWNCWRPLLGLGVLLLQVTAAAQSQPSVQALLQEARRRFETLEYERALVELHSAQRLSPVQDELVSIHLLRGVALAELGKTGEASDAFREALRLRPGAVLPLEVSPKISQQFQAISAALAVSKLESRKRSTESEPRPEPRLAPPEQPQKPPDIAASSPPQPASAAQAPSPLLPNINVTVNPSQNQEVNIMPPNSPVMPSPPRSQVLDRHILIPAGAGGVLAIAGGVFWGLARKEYKKIESDDPHLNSLPALEGSASNGRTYQTVGFGLMGAGLVGLGVAVGLYGMNREDSPVEFSVGTTGSQAVLHGKWQ
jgi:tetratricopeptide (TPR) repeat protein